LSLTSRTHAYHTHTRDVTENSVMRNLKLKCPGCNRLFRTEKGLAWHQLHIHEIRLTYANLKQEIDKQSLGQVPHFVRLEHLALIKQLTIATEAYTAYLRDRAEPPPDLKRERTELRRQLVDMEANYPALATTWGKP
jgi:uncharacterized C2H2 Zn-finger protein